MFLSDRDLAQAIDSKLLIVDPRPERIDTCAIDLHLDRIEEAKVWSVEKYEKSQRVRGAEPYLRIGSFHYKDFAPEYLSPVPADTSLPVFRDGELVVLRQNGFVLWQTKEEVGTPEEGARFVCFIEGKSSRARTGLLIHMTAPIIHANWRGKVTLEICNLGPFTVALKAGDAVAQLAVAALTSPPLERRPEGQIAIGQRNVEGGGSAIARAPGNG